MPAPLFYYHRGTPGGEGGVAIIELYGGAATERVGEKFPCEDVLQLLFRPRFGHLPRAGRSALGEVVDPDGDCVDEAVLARVPAAAMWSALDAWCLTIHGGLWVQERVLELLKSHGGRRLDTSEVLRLAVEAGALDGAQAQAYCLLIAAPTERAARFFLRQYRGELSSRVGAAAGWLEREGGRAKALEIVDGLLAGRRAAACLASPLRVLIAGRPNAGKSTLFNALVEDERAAVTAACGTTRDVLEELIAVEDYPLLLADSAGLRSAGAGAIEGEGIRRARDRLRGGACDGVLYLIPACWEPAAEDRAVLEQLDAARCLLVRTMADLGPAHSGSGAARKIPAYEISVPARTGLEELRRGIVHAWIDAGAPDGESPCAPFTLEQVRSLEKARELLRAGGGDLDDIQLLFIECLAQPPPLERADA